MLNVPGGMGLGGYQAGYCFDVTGSYAISFLGAALAGVVNLAVIGALALHLRWHPAIQAWMRRKPAPRNAVLVPARSNQRMDRTSPQP